jgi:DNA polymerase-1
MVLLTENITALAGVEFNLNSPKQLADVLFTHLALPTKGLKKNKNGYSTDVDTLSALRYAHPIIDEILAYRKVSKLYSTYVQGLLKVADENGDIHTDFKQALTATGRLSSAEPNLQNIPVRTAEGRELRRVFVPKSSDRILVDADYSQIELRLLAAFSQDESMCDAFLSGEDIHRRTAAAVFRLPEALVPDELRARAKAVNFGIIYGISAYSLSGDIGVSVAEAKRYMEDYFAEFPRIKDYLDGVIAAAESDGYTTTAFGRRRYIPELSSRIFAQRAFGKRVAMNSPIQGSAADIIKLAMVRVDNRLTREGLDAHLILQVHDELIVEARKADAERVRTILREEMEGAVSLAVPLTVSTAIGENWLQAEH